METIELRIPSELAEYIDRISAISGQDPSAVTAVLLTLGVQHVQTHVYQSHTPTPEGGG
jgi:hypothetical protein